MVYEDSFKLVPRSSRPGETIMSRWWKRAGWAFIILAASCWLIALKADVLLFRWTALISFLCGSVVLWRTMPAAASAFQRTLNGLALIQLLSLSLIAAIPGRAPV